MLRLLTSHPECPSLKSGLLSTTALSLTLLMVASTTVHAQTLTFDNGHDPSGPIGPGEWSLDPDNDTWLDGGANVPFTDGADVRFTTQGETTTLTDTVAPSSIFIEDSIGPDQIDTDGSSTLSTDGALDGTLNIDLEDGTLTINADITGSNDVIFNEAANSFGRITMNGDIANSFEVYGDSNPVNTATLFLFGTAGGDATVNSGIFSLEATGEVNGLTTVTENGAGNNLGTMNDLDVTGGTFVNQRLANVTGDVTVTNDGALRNLGNIGDEASDTVTVTGGLLENDTSTGGVGILRIGDIAGNLIIGQETDGAGTVTSTGTVDANGGTFNTVDVQTGGTFNVNEDTDADVTVSGGLANNDAELTGTVDITDGTFENTDDGSILGAVDMTGGTLNNLGAIGTNADPVSVSVTGGILNNNDSGGDQGTIAGPLTIGQEVSGGVVTSIGTVNANGGAFDTIDVQTGGQLTVTDETVADVTVSGGNADVNARLDGTLDVTDGLATTRANVAELVTVSGTGVLENQAELEAGVTVTGGEMNNTATSTITGPTNVSGGVLNNLANADVDGVVTVSDTGQFNNDGRLNQTVNVTGGTLTNQGAGQISDVTNISGTGVLENTAQILDTVNVTSGTLSNNARGNITGDVILSDTGTVNFNGGDFGVFTATGGTQNINVTQTRDIINDGSNIRINGNDIVTDTDPVPGSVGALIGILDSTSGTISTFADSSISGQVTLRGGSLLSFGGDYATGADILGGTVEIRGTTTMGAFNNSGGDVTNFARLGAPVINTGTGTITNRGVIAGTVDIQDGTFTQNDVDASVLEETTVSGGGAIIASEGAFENGIRGLGGDVTISGDVTGTITNAGTGFVEIDSDGDLTGDLISEDGTFEVAGILNGDLTVTDGDGLVTGTIEETVTLNDGILTVRNPTSPAGATAIVRGETTLNGGVLRALGGDFSGDIVAATGGDLRVLGDVSGEVRNTGGEVMIAEDGNLTGPLTQTAGSTTIAGTLTGTATINNDTLTTEDGARVTDVVTVDGGTLDAQGGAFEAGVDAESGNVNIVGDVTGDINNNGANVDVAATGQLTGDLSTTAGTTVNNGTIDGALAASGGTVMQEGGDVLGLTSAQDAGTLIISGGALTGGFEATGGSTRVTGTASATSFINDGGLVDIDGGTLNGTLTHNSGTTTISGTVAGLEVTGSGITTLSAANIAGATNITSGGVLDAAAGTFSGPATVATDGNLLANGASFTDPITNTGGRIDIEGDTAANIDNDAGLLIVHTGETLTGTVTNADNMSLNGTVAGAVNNTSGGTLTVAATRNGTVTAGLTNDAGGTVDLFGSLTADVTNAAGATFNVDGGALIGGFDNFGNMITIGANTVSGASTNAGDLTVQTGSLTINNSFENSSGRTTTINAGTTLSAADLLNTTTGRIINDGTLSGPVTNNGLITSTNGLTTGLVTNNGTVTGAAQFSGGLVNNGTVDLTGNATAGDRITVGGPGLSGSGSFALDLDLSNDIGGLGQSDYIIAEAGAPVTGTLSFDFTTLALGGTQANSIPVLDVDEAAANNFTYSTTGLPDPGETIIYSLEQNAANGDVFIVDRLNPGIGALAGSIVLTQSLIGSVINRPSSPFVNGLAYADEDPCGLAPWVRATGGSADSSGDITQDGDNAQTLNGEISADFYGLQAGGDFACFNGYYNGWDLAGGAIAGLNEGASSQPVFALDPSGELSGRITSVTDVDFRQVYGGVYGTAVRDRLAVELQYRLEKTDFTGNNVGRNGSIGLGLNESKFSSDSSTFSGSVSYVLDIPNTELSFVPVAGFAYTQVSTDPIVFEDGSIVQVEDFDSQVGFVGGTVSRTNFGEDGTTALNQFVTATYYNDFAADPRSTFTPTAGGEVRSITTENLGAYAEISAGLNYVKILEVGNGLNAKQFSASVRGDLRRSDQLDSWGITAQMRLQF